MEAERLSEARVLWSPKIAFAPATVSHRVVGHPDTRVRAVTAWGRTLGQLTVQKVELFKLLRLEIDDYSRDSILRPLVRSYNDLLTEYIAQRNIKLFLHSRSYF